MPAIKAFVRKRPALIYFVLAVALSWGCMALMIGPGNFPISPELAESQGALLYVGMLIGPSAAGLLLTALLDGGAGLRDLLSRLFRWRVGARWYAVALLTAPLVATVVLLLLSLLSPEFLPGIFASEDGLALLLSGVAAGLMVGLFEEVGWTGFAIPRLRQHYGILATGLLVGLVWGAWHFPPFWEANSFSGVFPLALLFARLFAWLPPYRVLMVWVYDRTDSLLVVVLMHASLVTCTLAIVPSTLAGASLLTWLFAWAAALWAVMGAVAVASRGQFSRPLSRRRLV
jgi:membrane protease YdiL (CAAX protease family)